MTLSLPLNQINSVIFHVKNLMAFSKEMVCKANLSTDEHAEYDLVTTQ